MIHTRACARVGFSQSPQGICVILGQSLWLENITSDLLRTGVLEHDIDELAVTGLTSNPTIFDHAIKNSTLAKAS